MLCSHTPVTSVRRQNVTTLLEYSSVLALLGVTVPLPVVIATRAVIATYVVMATLDGIPITLLACREGSVVAMMT